MASFNPPDSRLDGSTHSGLRTPCYLMESPEEAVRLEMKTEPGAVRKQAQWCGVKPGLRVLDVG